METMKAARVHEWGKPLVLDDVPLPEPKGNQILIRVRATSINPVDWKAQQGYMSQFLTLPTTLGWEASGEITALGDGAADNGLKVGDAVYAKMNGGGFAQYVVVPSDTVALKPKALSYQQAAAFPVAALTAYQALFDHGGLQSGQKVLIHGAAGGVGHFAVQLAKWKGAHVIATGSAQNESFLRGLGADDFIDYQKLRFEDVVQDADVVFDTVGGDTLNRSYAVVKRGGIVVTIAGRPSEEQMKTTDVRSAGFSSTGTRAQLDDMTRLIEAGSVKPTISATFPLEQVEQALDQNKAGHTRGKIVIEVA